MYRYEHYEQVYRYEHYEQSRYVRKAIINLCLLLCLLFFVTFFDVDGQLDNLVFKYFTDFLMALSSNLEVASPLRSFIRRMHHFLIVATVLIWFNYFYVNIVDVFTV